MDFDSTFQLYVYLMMAGCLATVVVGVIQNVQIMRNKSKDGVDATKASKKLESPAPSTNVDMTPPVLQQSAASVTPVSRSKQTFAAQSAKVKSFCVSAMERIRNRTTKLRTVSGYEAQWYSVEGVTLRKPGEPAAVRRDDPKSLRLAKKLRREIQARHAHEEGRVYADKLERHLMDSGVM